MHNKSSENTTIEDDAMATVSAEGALLWLLHVLLRTQWHPVNERHQLPSALELRCFAGNVSLLPAVTYQMNPHQQHEQQERDGGAVDVRAVKVQQKLFVHFVSADDATLRLPLL